jgi:nucleoside-diphosphate-sugar epimerase
MKVFVTGATGFIGSAVTRELLAAGHQVLGLARSDKGAEALSTMGAQVQRGSLEDLDSLRNGAAASDGVMHCAFIHDFSNYAASAAADKNAIEAMGTVLVGSNRPLIVSAGTAGLALGRPVTEEDGLNMESAAIGRLSEVTAIAFATQGLPASSMRFPPTVHGEGDHGFVAQLVSIARAKGVSGYPGDGLNRWAAVHRLDAARLCRLALESAPVGARIHAVGDEGVTTRAIAEVIGRQLNLPVVSVPNDEVATHFGWLGAFFALDIPASSALTQARFGWHPANSSLLDDLEAGHYFKQQEPVA